LVVWPQAFSERFWEVVVLENPASILHFVAAIALTLLGCGRQTFWAYTAYQVYTTIAKTLAFPEHTLADWPDDMLGDIVEYAAGIGVAWAAGLDSRVSLPGRLASACTWRGVMVGLALVTLVWAAFFVWDLYT